MKKIFLLVSILTLSTLALAEKNVVEVRGGYDLDFKSKVDGNDVSDQFDNGFSLGLEYRREIINGLELGGGLEFQNNKYNGYHNTPWTNGDYYTMDTSGLNTIPLYLTARYNFKNSSKFIPYVKMNLGYSINTGGYTEDLHFVAPISVDSVKQAVYDFKNGLYYSLGLGVTYEGFLIDLSYEMNDFKVSGDYLSDYSISSSGIDYANYTNDEGKLKNQKIKLSVGYQLGF